MIACTSPADVITLPLPLPRQSRWGVTLTQLMIACTSPADVITLPLPLPRQSRWGVTLTR